MPIEQQECPIKAKPVDHKEPISEDELVVLEFPNQQVIRQLTELEIGL